MNIAEGKGRHSQKEFMQFLYIARGSLYETLTLLEILRLRGWSNAELFDEIELKANEIAKMINGLIKSVARNQ